MPVPPAFLPDLQSLLPGTVSVYFPIRPRPTDEARQEGFLDSACPGRRFVRAVVPLSLFDFSVPPDDPERETDATFFFIAGGNDLEWALDRVELDGDRAEDVPGFLHASHGGTKGILTAYVLETEDTADGPLIDEEADDGETMILRVARRIALSTARDFYLGRICSYGNAVFPGVPEPPPEEDDDDDDEGGTAYRADSYAGDSDVYRWDGSACLTTASGVPTNLDYDEVFLFRPGFSGPTYLRSVEAVEVVDERFAELRVSVRPVYGDDTIGSPCRVEVQRIAFDPECCRPAPCSDGSTVTVTVRHAVADCGANPTTTEPVEGAEVTIRRAGDDVVVGTGTTDASGQVVLDVPDGGQYEVLACKDDCCVGDFGVACGSFGANAPVVVEVEDCQPREVGISLCCTRVCVTVLDYDTGAPIEGADFGNACVEANGALYCLSASSLRLGVFANSEVGDCCASTIGQSAMCSVRAPGYWGGFVSWTPRTCFETTTATTVYLYSKLRWVKVCNPCGCPGACYECGPTRRCDMIPRTLFAQFFGRPETFGAYGGGAIVTLRYEGTGGQDCVTALPCNELQCRHTWRAVIDNPGSYYDCTVGHTDGFTGVFIRDSCATPLFGTAIVTLTFDSCINSPGGNATNVVCLRWENVVPAVPDCGQVPPQTARINPVIRCPEGGSFCGCYQNFACTTGCYRHGVKSWPFSVSTCIPVDFPGLSDKAATQPGHECAGVGTDVFRGEGRNLCGEIDYEGIIFDGANERTIGTGGAHPCCPAPNDFTYHLFE